MLLIYLKKHFIQQQMNMNDVVLLGRDAGVDS
jgi:hypothetical protein